MSYICLTLHRRCARKTKLPTPYETPSADTEPTSIRLSLSLRAHPLPNLIDIDPIRRTGTSQAPDP